MSLTILFPDRKLGLNLDEEDWKGMKGALDASRQDEKWWGFSNMAMNLTILAAEDAHITSDGRIEITPKKPKLTSEPTPLPTRPR